MAKTALRREESVSYLLDSGPWTAQAVPRYNKTRKRLSTAVKQRLNEVQSQILQDPRRGDRKKGALRDVYLLAYTMDEKTRTVTFYDIGQHENFYRRDLAKYLKTKLL